MAKLKLTQADPGGYVLAFSDRFRWSGDLAPVLGGASGLNYATDYRNADGIVVPTKRRVYTHDANKQKIPDPVLVAIDIRDIAFSAAWDASDSTVRRH